MLTVKKFYGSWCIPCKQIAPIFEQLKVENNNVIFEDFDVDQNKEYALSLGIRSVPTVIFEKDGIEVLRLSGAKMKSDYQKVIIENV